MSSDHEKLEVLGKKYDVEHCVTYEGYESLLKSDDIDAVYIALPIHMHAESHGH